MNIENDSFISIKLIGFRKHDAEKFCAILDLAEFALQPPWQVVKTAAADFYLILDKSQANAIKNMPRERCLFYSTDASKINDNSVWADTDRTPRLHALIQLLNRLALQANQPLAAPNSKIPSPPKSKPEQKPVQPPPKTALTTPETAEPVANVKKAEKPAWFDPQQGVLKDLLETNTQPFMLMLKTRPEHNPVFVYPDKKAYYCQASLEELEAFFTLDSAVVKTPLTLAELNKAVKKAALSPQPLSHLIWYAAFTLSQGQLIQGHSAQDSVRLAQLPYLGGADTAYRELATFLKRNAAPLDKAAQATGTPLATAHSFYNACHIAGLLEKSTATAHKQSFFDKLKNHLKS
ncbi:MAG: hypothetical protein PHU14_06385 [Methylovulum sp.]|nr:hypothetical protein [Methylovulum sp.]